MTETDNDMAGDRGEALLELTLVYLEQRNFSRRPRMGRPGFDFLGPDGRVLIYGFEPKMAGEPAEVAVHLWHAAQRFLK